ncbi:AraC family transcriptional regulator [Pontibacter sp. G13]|uniref:helix-turn-helix transcriptional regulator n=1 Tax=Pontibacter sp. G13 TaxID=3074898 RepID=UPI00288ACEA4|nr:AraC family transcriptional regulator [Pontibacter sp. G13]WNJ20558.1 AraC family transcriptional regulator [Pontibacter sp. G13]
MLQEFYRTDQARVDISSIDQIDVHSQTHGIALKMVIEGHEQYQVGTFNGKVQKGQMLLLDEKTPFIAHIHESRPQIGMCVDLPKSWVQSISEPVLEIHDSKQWEIPAAVYTLEAYPFYQQMRHFHRNLSLFNWQGEGHEYLFELATHFHEFLLTIRGERAKIPAVKRSTKWAIHQRLHVALSYVHDQMRNPFSLSDIAAVSMLSEYHLCRLFRKVYGKTLFQYHEHLKLEASKRLLQSGHYSVVEVSDELGFTDQSYFAKRFRKATGTSPGKYARSYRTA